MADEKAKYRYWIRGLLGFDLVDIEQFNDLETAKKRFKYWIDYISKNKQNNAPFLLMLVDAKENKILDQYEEIEKEIGEA